MPLLFEIRVRINGEERWADARKMFDYLYKECVNKDYKGDGEIPLNSEEKNEQFMSWWNLYAKKTDKKKTSSSLPKMVTLRSGKKGTIAQRLKEIDRAKSSKKILSDIRTSVRAKK